MTRIRRSGVLAVLATATVLVSACSTAESGTAVASTGAKVSTSTSSSAPKSFPSVSLPSAPTTSPQVLPPTLTTAPSTSTVVVTVSSTPTTPTPTTTATTATPTTPAPPTKPPTTPPSTSRPPTTAKAAVTPFPVCPNVSGSNLPGIVTCLRTSVSDFWSGQLNETINQPVVLDPSTSQVPADCRPGLTEAPAFTCQVDDTVYINQSFVDLITRQFGAADVPYALASVVSHEIGHVVQAAVHQPGYNKTGTSNTISQQIEQQADCLSGVWAVSESSQGRLDTKTFEVVSKQLITDISSNPEIATHGTPDQRAAAILTGMAGGRPQDCQLATFS